VAEGDLEARSVGSCSVRAYEEVRWFVLKTPVKIANSEITAFGKLYPMNARPTQPLNGRAIEATR
jgi:carbonic anhydrase